MNAPGAAASERPEPPACFHCGLPVPLGPAHAVVVEGAPRAMCCAGCAAVAQAIVDNGLEAYYRHRTALPEGPEVVPPALAALRHYDLPEIQKSFVREGGGHVREAALMLEGITGACARETGTPPRSVPARSGRP